MLLQQIFPVFEKNGGVNNPRDSNGNQELNQNGKLVIFHEFVNRNVVHENGPQEIKQEYKEKRIYNNPGPHQ
jgi:hypothetical protein